MPLLKDWKVIWQALVPLSLSQTGKHFIPPTFKVSEKFDETEQKFENFHKTALRSVEKKAIADKKN